MNIRLGRYTGKFEYQRLLISEAVARGERVLVVGPDGDRVIWRDPTTGVVIDEPRSRLESPLLDT